MAEAGFEGPLWSAEKVRKFAQNRQRTDNQADNQTEISITEATLILCGSSGGRANYNKYLNYPCVGITSAIFLDLQGKSPKLKWQLTYNNHKEPLNSQSLLNAVFLGPYAPPALQAPRPPWP